MGNRIFDAMTFGNRQPIWQSLGTTFNVNISATDALREIGGDFDIIKAQTYAAVDGRPIKLHNKFELMRKMPDESFVSFGSCHRAYEVMQRREFTNIIDNITVRWPLETAGQLNDGQTFFCMLNAGSFEIRGDPLVMYYMLVDTADGGTSAKSVFTPLRLYCYNALQVAMRKAAVNMPTVHRVGIRRDIESVFVLMEKMVKAQTTTLHYFDLMSRGVFTPEQMVRVFKTAYPDPKRPVKIDMLEIIGEEEVELADIRADGKQAEYTYNYYLEKAAELRDAASILLEKFNDEQPTIANTGYAVYNVVAELADWRQGSGEVEVDSLFGQRSQEKKHAFAAVMHEL
jgi:hypothetical protein